MGPDGSQHNFYERLHPTEPDGRGRLLHRSTAPTCGSTSAAPRPTIESPDGLVRTFSLARRALSADGRWRTVSVTGCTSAYDATSWTITDSHGRSHVVTLNERRPGDRRRSRCHRRLNGRGQRSSTISTTPPRASSGTDFHREPCDFNPDHTETEDGQLLTSLDLPDGTELRLHLQHGRQHLHQLLGAIRSVALPTGGRIEWDYATYGFKSQAPTVQDSSRKPSNAEWAPGVPTSSMKKAITCRARGTTTTSRATGDGAERPFHGVLLAPDAGLGQRLEHGHRLVFRNRRRRGQLVVRPALRAVRPAHPLDHIDAMVHRQRHALPLDPRLRAAERR